MTEQPHNPSQPAEAVFTAKPQPSPDIGVVASARVQRVFTALSPWARHWLRADGAANAPLLSHTARPTANTVSLQPANLMAEVGSTVHFAQQILRRHHHQGVLHTHPRPSSTYATILRQVTDLPLAGLAADYGAAPTTADWPHHEFIAATTVNNHDPGVVSAQGEPSLDYFGEAARSVHPTQPESITTPAVDLHATPPPPEVRNSVPRSSGSVVAEIRRRIQRASELAATTASPSTTQTASVEQMALKPDPTKPSLTAAIQERIRQAARNQLATADARTDPGAATAQFPGAAATAAPSTIGGGFSRTAAIREQIRRAALDATEDVTVDPQRFAPPSSPRRAEVTEFPHVSRATAMREQVRRARRASPSDGVLPAQPTSGEPPAPAEETVLPSPTRPQPAPQAPAQPPRRQVYSQVNEYKTLPPPPARPDPALLAAPAVQRFAQAPPASRREYLDDPLSAHQAVTQPWQQEQTTEQPEHLTGLAVEARPAMQVAEQRETFSSPAATVVQRSEYEGSQPLRPPVVPQVADPPVASQPLVVGLPAQQQTIAMESVYTVRRASVDTPARAADVLQASAGIFEPPPTATGVTGRGEPPILFPAEAPATGLVTATELTQVAPKSNNQPLQHTPPDVGVQPLTVAAEVAADGGNVQATPPTEPTPRIPADTVYPIRPAASGTQPLQRVLIEATDVAPAPAIASRGSTAQDRRQETSQSTAPMTQRTVAPVAGHELVVTEPTAGQMPPVAASTSARDSAPFTTQAMTEAKVQRLASPAEPAPVSGPSAPTPGTAINKAALSPQTTLPAVSSATPITSDQSLQRLSAAVSVPQIATPRDTFGDDAEPPAPTLPATSTITDEPALMANSQPAESAVRRVTEDEGLPATPTAAWSYDRMAIPDTVSQDTDQKPLLGVSQIREPAGYNQPVATGLSAEQRTGMAETVSAADAGSTTDQRPGIDKATVQRSAIPVEPASTTAPDAASRGATRTIVLGEPSLPSPSVADESTPVAPTIGNAQLQRRSADVELGNGDQSPVTTLSATTSEWSLAAERPPSAPRKQSESAGQHSATASPSGGSDNTSAVAQDSTPRSAIVQRTGEPVAQQSQVSTNMMSMAVDAVSLHKNLYRAATHDLPLAQRVIYRAVPTNPAIDGTVTKAGGPIQPRPAAAPRTLAAPQPNGHRLAQRAPSTDAMATEVERTTTVHDPFTAADSANGANGQVLGVTIAPSIQPRSVAAAGTPSAQLNLDQIARQVLPFIKRLLLLERDRSYWR